MGFSLDPRVHRGGCSTMIRGTCSGVEDDQRQGGRRSWGNGGRGVEKPHFAIGKAETAVFAPADLGSATVPACFVDCGFRGLIRLPQLLDLIQNVLQEKFGVPVGSTVAYLRMVIGTEVCCCRYQIAERHVSGQRLYKTTGLSQRVLPNAFLITHLFTPVLIYLFNLYTHPLQ